MGAGDHDHGNVLTALVFPPGKDETVPCIIQVNSCVISRSKSSGQFQIELPENREILYS
jgi:hypothetical protein